MYVFSASGQTRRAGFPDCRFGALFSAPVVKRLSRIVGTRGWKAPLTGRLESLPYEEARLIRLDFNDLAGFDVLPPEGGTPNHSPNYNAECK
jgi:hypothetical protein